MTVFYKNFKHDAATVSFDLRVARYNESGCIVGNEYAPVSVLRGAHTRTMFVTPQGSYVSKNLGYAGPDAPLRHDLVSRINKLLL